MKRSQHSNLNEVNRKSSTVTVLGRNENARGPTTVTADIIFFLSLAFVHSLIWLGCIARLLLSVRVN